MNMNYALLAFHELRLAGNREKALECARNIQKYFSFDEEELIYALVNSEFDYVSCREYLSDKRGKK